MQNRSPKSTKTSVPPKVAAKPSTNAKREVDTPQITKLNQISVIDSENADTSSDNTVKLEELQDAEND